MPFAQGVISTPGAGGLAFAPDGKTVYFGKNSAVMISHFEDGTWSAPVVAPFSGKYDGEGAPSLSADGSRLFYSSFHPAEGKPKGPSNFQGWWDIWYVDRAGDSWSEPRVVGGGENGEWSPLTLRTGTPSVAGDGTLYYFRCVDFTCKNTRLVRSKPTAGRYLDFEDLGEEVNGPYGASDIAVAPDQSFIVFSSKRPDSLGEHDLYISYGQAGHWSEPRNLGPKVNSTDNEFLPSLSRDQKYLFFNRGSQGILRVTLASTLPAHLTAVGHQQIANLQTPKRETNDRSGQALTGIEALAKGILSVPGTGGIAFDPDARTVYFGRNTTIMISHLQGGKWTEPVVAPFSGTYPDGDPSVTRDGSRLFYWSLRPAAGKPAQRWWDLWYVDRAGDSWSEPRVVGGGDNGEWSPLTSFTGTPSIAADGTLYYFRCVDHTCKKTRIVRSRTKGGRYLDFEDLGETINGQYGAFDMTVAPDQSFIIFSSRRPDSLGNYDLYISYWRNDRWSVPQSLGPKVNSKEGEYSPSLSPDGKYLFFTRGNQGIFYVPLAEVEIPEQPHGSGTPIAKPAEFVPGRISTPEQACLTLSPDGKTAYFGRHTPQPVRLMASHFRNGEWSAPERLPFSGPASGREFDGDPAMSPDGKRLFFVSRKLPDGAPQIWAANKEEDGWSTPQPVADGGCGPSVAADGTLYFCGKKSDTIGGTDIYRARLINDKYGAPENLGSSINSAQDEYDAYIAPDQSYLIFVSKRPGGRAENNLNFYISYQRQGQWTAARLFAPEVLAAGGVCPLVSPDGRYFLYTSTINGHAGIYRVQMEVR